MCHKSNLTDCISSNILSIPLLGNGFLSNAINRSAICGSGTSLEVKQHTQNTVFSRMKIQRSFCRVWLGVQLICDYFKNIKAPMFVFSH